MYHNAFFTIIRFLCDALLLFHILVALISSFNPFVSLCFSCKLFIRHPVFFWQGKSGQGSKRNDLKNIVASRSMMSDTSLLIICMLAASPLVAIETEWPGLGVSECRNRSTCHVGEFCSLKSDIFGDCRNCSLLIQWCYQDFDYLRRNYPSCEATCERKLHCFIQ